MGQRKGSHKVERGLQRSCRKRYLIQANEWQHRQQEARWGTLKGPVGTQCLIIGSLPFVKGASPHGQEASSIHSCWAFVEHVDLDMTDEEKAPRWSISCQTPLTGNKLSAFPFTKAPKQRGLFSIQWKFEYDYYILLINVITYSLNGDIKNTQNSVLFLSHVENTASFILIPPLRWAEARCFSSCLPSNFSFQN